MQSGHGCMPGSVERLSPVRNISALSGRSMFCVPDAQFVVPARSFATVLMTHVLVGVLFALGIGSGAPKRHPVELQLRLVPVSADVVGPSVAVWSRVRHVGDVGTVWNGGAVRSTQSPASVLTPNQ